jgi:hypothetical protein
MYLHELYMGMFWHRQGLPYHTLSGVEAQENEWHSGARTE